MAIRVGKVSVQRWYRSPTKWNGWRDILGQVQLPRDFGAIRRIRFILLPVRSRSGSRLKSLSMDAAQVRAFGRGLRLCPKIAKMAAEVCPSARGANNPKFRTACW